MKINHFIHQIAHHLKRIYEWTDRKAVIPLYRKLITTLSTRCEKKITRYGMTSQWKEQTLRDFSLWLSDLPESRTFQHPPEVADCDLYTLLSEFSGLRQEIRLQNREQSKSVKSVNSFVDAYMETFELLKKNASDLKQLHADTSRSAEKKALSHFFDVRDTLVRGADAVRRQKNARGFWSRGKRDLDNILESYEISIRKFDRALAFSEITPTETMGKSFDPKTMKAISVTTGKTHKAAEDAAIVIEEACGGFSRKNEVLRYAEVVVEKRL